MREKVQYCSQHVTYLNTAHLSAQNEQAYSKELCYDNARYEDRDIR